MPNAVTGLQIRSIRPDEDERVLDALNRHWAGTWNFVSIPFEMLQRDLDGQREGMLLGVDTSDRIIATCHAVYEPGEQNPDGNPRAWISNLTVGPEYRQRGIARVMLAAGIAHLRARGNHDFFRGFRFLGGFGQRWFFATATSGLRHAQINDRGLGDGLAIGTLDLRQRVIAPANNHGDAARLLRNKEAQAHRRGEETLLGCLAIFVRLLGETC